METFEAESVRDHMTSEEFLLIALDLLLMTQEVAEQCMEACVRSGRPAREVALELGLLEKAQVERIERVMATAAPDSSTARTRSIRPATPPPEPEEAPGTSCDAMLVPSATELRFHEGIERPELHLSGEAIPTDVEGITLSFDCYDVHGEIARGGMGRINDFALFWRLFAETDHVGGLIS